MRPFNKTTATLVRPHPFSTLCPTPLGNSPVCTDLGSAYVPQLIVLVRMKIKVTFRDADIPSKMKALFVSSLK